MSKYLDAKIALVEIVVPMLDVHDEPTRNIFDDYAHGYNTARAKLLAVLRDSSMSDEYLYPVQKSHEHKACWRRIDEYTGGAMCCECVPHKTAGCDYGPRNFTGFGIEKMGI